MKDLLWFMQWQEASIQEAIFVYETIFTNINSLPFLSLAFGTKEGVPRSRKKNTEKFKCRSIHIM